MAHKPAIAITAGDVAGIGPEIVVRALQDERVTAACRPVVLCHPEILKRAAQLCGIHPVQIDIMKSAPQSPSAIDDGGDCVIHCYNPCGDGVLSAGTNGVHGAAGKAAYEYLVSAINLAKAGVVDAIATAPLNKASLHAAGHDFPGHTEILANECGVRKFGMMLHLPEQRRSQFQQVFNSSASGEPRHGVSITHVTLHTSIKSVPLLLTTEKIVDQVHLMHEFLSRIGCHRRAIAVCALNPHGGEAGLFGDEEDRMIHSAVERALAERCNVKGPLPVDTLMRRAFAGEFDGVVAMYHDQGHIPVKLIGFDAAVNITLGLPIVRTSPTHGTAFDRAWNSDSPADATGMIEAIVTAAALTQQA